MKPEKESDVLDKRRQKIDQLRTEKIRLYPNDFRTTHSIGEIRALIEDAPDSLAENSPVFAVAGRLMAINRFGKSSFVRLRDRSGQLQAYLRMDLLGEAAYAIFRQLDIGDFIGVAGGLFQTKTGEWTLLAKEMRLLSKAIRPLPEKYHGLRDPEKRYRKRYLDLLMNPEVREIFVKRSLVIQSIRSFLLDRDFLEVETPMMQPIPGGAEATPFVTHHNALDMDLYLRIAPELYLKRLVVGGLERVFEINRNFRNEGISTQHNPEFTMLEFYQAYATHEDLMALTEAMLAEAARRVTGEETIAYQGETISLAAPWRRITLADALEQIGGVERAKLGDREALLAVAADRQVHVTKT
ncbi:MAG: OB-fold nucleic acid binding domain-containing protein, partial [Desulfobacterales bacterium]